MTLCRQDMIVEFNSFHDSKGDTFVHTLDCEMTYGEKLIELMTVKGFTTKSLSEATGGEIPMPTINQIRQDMVSSPQSHTLQILCKTMGVSMQEFDNCEAAAGRQDRKRRKKRN